MKTFALFTLLLSLISNIYSYQFNYGNRLVFPEVDIKYTVYTSETGYPEVDVVKGPNHYENNNEFVDVVGTSENYMKKYLPELEYRLTSITEFHGEVYVNMAQQYKGVDIEGTYLRLVINPMNGIIKEVTVHAIKTAYSGSDFENRNDEVTEAKFILEQFNKNQFDGVLDMSGISIDEKKIR